MVNFMVYFCVLWRAYLSIDGFFNFVMWMKMTPNMKGSLNTLLNETVYKSLVQYNDDGVSTTILGFPSNRGHFAYKDVLSGNVTHAAEPNQRHKSEKEGKEESRQNVGSHADENNILVVVVVVFSVVVIVATLIVETTLAFLLCKHSLLGN